MNRFRVDYLLIGGMNFLLRHAPITTNDIDLWIRDLPDNRDCCEAALVALDAEWGQTDADWSLVRLKPPGWLGLQAVFCLNSPDGAIELFFDPRLACQIGTRHGKEQFMNKLPAASSIMEFATKICCCASLRSTQPTARQTECRLWRRV